MTIRAILFDAYGTVWDVHSIARRCESYWPGRAAQLSQLWRAKQLEYTWQRSLMGRYVPFAQITREALEYACAALALPLDSGRADALMHEYLRLDPYPDAPGALRKLGALKTGILTNGSPDMIGPLVSHSGMRFDAVLSVDEAKIFKPAPAAYEIALRAFQAQAGELALVSSNCWDAMGAKSFGFRVYWINRLGAPVDRLGFQPDAVLASLGELPEILL